MCDTFKVINKVQYEVIYSEGEKKDQEAYIVLQG